MSIELIVIAIVLMAISGLPGVFLKRTAKSGQYIATVATCSAAILGLIGVWSGFDKNQNINFIWPAMGNAIIGLDALSCFFLVPVFLISSLGSIYGLGYWPQNKHLRNGRKLRLFWGLLTSGMALLVIGRQAMAFLLGWEIMALSAFFLVSTEDNKPQSRQAGWIYFVATHIGTLTLFGLFAMWRWLTGSYNLNPIQSDSIGLGAMNIMFLLCITVFGMKAGVIPFHFWLPSAHANAPSHISAVLSGVMLKMGIYGLVRFLSLLPDPPQIWGTVIILLGCISGLLGVLFAIGQHDIKRLLAYHSIENIGIILLGLGLAMLGRSTNHPVWIVLGMAGCLVHTWNHCLFKSLLFFSAGSVVHKTHTRQIELLGGLAKSMPITSTMFLVGAVAICGLPPLNGFISELFIYLGLLDTVKNVGVIRAESVIAIPALAMIGALALACFVKVFGAVFLGTPRTNVAKNKTESPITMLVPMIILAACCLIIGLAPFSITAIVDRAIADWTVNTSTQNIMSITDISPLKLTTAMSVLLIIFILLILTIFSFGKRILRYAPTWDCGYAKPTSRIQYSASSFAQMIVTIFSWILRPHNRLPNIEGLFPNKTQMSSHINELILDRAILPFANIAERWFGWFRRFQQGLTQQYLLYILIVVILMMSTMIPFKEIIMRLFTR